MVDVSKAVRKGKGGDEDEAADNKIWPDIAGIALAMATVNVSSTCMFHNYQESVPSGAFSLNVGLGSVGGSGQWTSEKGHLDHYEYDKEATKVYLEVKKYSLG